MCRQNSPGVSFCWWVVGLLWPRVPMSLACPRYLILCFLLWWIKTCAIVGALYQACWSSVPGPIHGLVHCLHNQLCLVTGSGLKHSFSWFYFLWKSFILQVASNSTIVTIMVPVVFVLSETLGTNPLYLALGKKKICYMKKHTFFRSNHHCQLCLHAACGHPLQCHCLWCWTGEKWLLYLIHTMSIIVHVK